MTIRKEYTDHNPQPLNTTLTERDPLLPATILHVSPLPLLSPPPSSPSSDLYGYCLMGLSTIGFSGMSLFIHTAEHTYNFPPASSLFIRAMLHIFLAFIYITQYLNASQLISQLTPHQWRLLALRGTSGAFGIASVFIALNLLPLGDATGIFFCGPVITLFLSYCVLSESFTIVEFVAGIISLIGVVIITRAESDPSFTVSLHARLLGSLCAIAAAFLSAVSYVTVRSLGTGINFMFSVVSLSLGCILLSIIMGGAIGPEELMNSGLGGVYAVLAALFAFSGQCCINKGLQHCRAGPGTIIRNLDVPLSYILGLLFLGEIPSFGSILGSSLVLGATLTIGIRQLMRV